MAKNFKRAYLMSLISLMTITCSCNEKGKKTFPNNSDTANNTSIKVFSDSSNKLYLLSAYVNRIKIDSINESDLTDYKPVFKCEKKIGTLKVFANYILITTDSQTLHPCNLHFFKIGSDSSVLFSGVSYKKKVLNPLNDGIAYYTVLTNIFSK